MSRSCSKIFLLNNGLKEKFTAIRPEKFALFFQRHKFYVENFSSAIINNILL